MTAGYSGKPLGAKLGLAGGQRVLALRLPDAVRELLPGDVPLATEAAPGPWDVVLTFETSLGELTASLPEHLARLAPDGMIWVAWPKKSPPRGVAPIATDLGEDRVREVALPLGLVDVKVCAVDARWSGLKLVIRKALRPRG